MRKLMITLAVPLPAIAVVLAASVQAGAQTSHPWASYDNAAASLYSHNPPLTRWAFNPPTSTRAGVTETAVPQ